MPSGYTHMLLARTFKEEAGLTDHELDFILGEQIKYFQLGALGPDLPYSQELTLANRSAAQIADKFHYEKTNQIPIRAFNRIKNMVEGEKQDQAFAFFLGFASHIVADGIIHPFVRDKVGDYEKNKPDHRTLEMRLDVIFLNHLTKTSGRGQNLNNTNFHDQILDPLNKDFTHISSLFSRLIFEVYGPRLSPSDVEGWVKGMHRVFEIAESSNNQFYAWMPIMRDYLFHDHKKVIAEAEQDLLLKVNEANNRDVNFAGKDVHFIKDCVPAFHRVFKKVALSAYEFVYENGNKFDGTCLPSINLDTGRSLLIADGKNLNAKADYWEMA